MPHPPRPPQRPAARRPTVVNRRVQPRAPVRTLPRIFAPWGGRPLPTRPPAAAAPASASPAPTPASAGPRPLPPDAAYLAAINAAGLQRDTTLAGLTQQRAAGLLDYGYTEGAGGQLAVDPNNPFSKAALLKRTYDTSRRATGQSMATAGQLYSGAFQNSQDAVNRNQLQAQDQLQTSLAGFLSRNTLAQKQAPTDYENAVSGAESDRMGRLDTNPLYDPQPASTSKPATTPAPAAGTIVKPSAANGGRPWRYRRGASGKLIPLGPA